MRSFASKTGAAVVLVLIVAIVSATGSTGSTASNTREGCVNSWLFNGIWRVQVTGFAPLLDGGQFVGWQVTEVWRNGSSVELAPSDSLLTDQKLELPNGSVIAATDSTTGSLSMGQVGFHSFPVSGQFTYTQQFRGNGMDAASKPRAIDITFDAAKLATYRFKPHFTTAQYNFRFKLDCQATAAEAQAEGGSAQVAGQSGCLNQWMSSNGVWKMRATAIGEDHGSDPSSPQIGWMITQQWVNLTSRPLAPGDVNVSDEQLVLASGNTVASSNSAGTSMNFSELAIHTFKPGEEFTHQQRFRYGPFNPADKPVRLLVTFNADAQNQRENMPHYKLPANYRISFACTK